MADVTPVYKKSSGSVKDNYHHVGILPNFSKVFKRCLHNQVSPYFDNTLSENQCEFKKNHSAQHCLLALLEKWEKFLGKDFGKRCWGTFD